MPINHQESNKRLVKNTLTLYLRMILTVGISLYTSRVIIDNLGISDFGLYNVIGGFIAMFYMVTSSMSSATSRFITFELGINNIERQKTIFCTSMNLQIFVSLFVILIGETIGLWFINEKMVFEPERLFAANIVYQLALISFVIELLGVPFNSTIIAHEKIKCFAYITIVNIILKLFVAWALAVSPFDRVVFYALCMMIISSITQLLYFIYCKRNFEECEYKISFDKTISKQMFSFGGWSFLSSITMMLRGQGLNILINIFNGTIANAAYGVGRQIDATVKSFSNNFITALNPQITKSYALGDKEHTKNLVYKGTKYSFLLLYEISLPVIVETNKFLDIWLVEVPKYSVEFVRITLIFQLFKVLTVPIQTLNNATGHIKSFQILKSITEFLVLPTCYILLRIGIEPYITMLVTVGSEIIMIYPKIWICRKYGQIKIKEYHKEVFGKIFYVILFTSLLCTLITDIMDQTIYRLIIVTFISVVSVFLFTYLFALNKPERQTMISFVTKFKFRK